MKKFWKYVLATIVGVIAGALLLFILFIGLISSLTAGKEDTYTLKDNSVLELRFTGQILDRKEPNPLEDLPFFEDQKKEYGLKDILESIKKAGERHEIKGIFMDPERLQAGYATCEEIRNALLEFKKTGKFVVAYAGIYSQKAYYLCSAADVVYMNPTGMLELKGLAAQRIYFKNILEKVGVEVQIVKHGKYKSAVEPFIREDMSEPAREQTKAYLSSMWNHFLDEVSQTRSLSADQVNALASENMLFQEAEEILKTGLVDSLKYRFEVLDQMKRLTHRTSSQKLRLVSINDMSKVPAERKNKGLAKEKIAVIWAEGDIDGSGDKGIKSHKLTKEIRKARKDTSVKAIVLRVNSPGGSAYGSEQIWHELMLAKKDKPLIVSMGDLAASGGYYISCGADAIFAHPNTITGSIGIFGMIPNAKGLFDKLGINFDVEKTNQYADMPSITRSFTEDERDMMQAYIERGYKLFIKRCADGRSTTTAQIDSVGQGRVWSGENAKELGLVDYYGGLQDAIAYAVEKAGVKHYRLKHYPEERDMFKELLESLTAEAQTKLMRERLGVTYPYFETLQKLPGLQGVQARLPYEISVQ